MRSIWLPLAVAIVLPLGGCEKESANNAPPPPPTAREIAGDPEVNRWLLDVAREHQVPAEMDGDWVAFTGTAVRMNGFFPPGDTGGGPDRVILQVNFRVLLPNGKMVVQPVAGWGKTREEAVASAQASFLLGSFHAFLGAFVDPAEQHVQQEHRTLGGRPRVVTYGGVLTKTMDGDQPEDD